MRAISLPTVEDDIRNDALDVLREAVLWRLAGDRWSAVDRALDALAAALAANEADAFRDGVHDLELAGPTRAVRIEDTSVLPAPVSVRVRINELVHTLEGSRRSDEQDTADNTTAAAD
jgi:hypothetical protein